MTATAERIERARIEAVPFFPSPDRMAVVSYLMRKMAEYESIFTDYQRACIPMCDDATKCPRCASRLLRISAVLLDPKARVWEAWQNDEKGTRIIGVIYLTDIVAGGDAHCHYLFFDNELRGKQSLLENMIAWCFADHPDEGWVALRRLTVEVPDFAFALARHAHNKLGFGGPYLYKGKKGAAVQVEGVKKSAIPWRGTHADLLLLGRVNGTIH